MSAYEGEAMTNPTDPERPRATQRVPETDDFPSGPAVGATLPDFSLPDQRGRIVDYDRERAGRRALVGFVRSARW